MAKVRLFLNFMQLICFYNMFHTIYGKHETLSGLSLKIVHWNSPESPSYKPNRTHKEITNELVEISRIRIKALEHHLNALNTTEASSNKPIRPTLEIPTNTGALLVQVGIGTFQTDPPFQTNYLALDMAFSHTWTQCQGCSPCFDQRGPLFPWNHSTTYHQVGYTRVGYANGFIEGHESFETFTFQSSRNRNVQVQNVRFMCVLKSQSYHGGAQSGIFSLSRLGYSDLMWKVRSKHVNNGRFSYCLPPLDKPTKRPIYLRFGSDISSVSYFQTTPILHSPIPGNLHYYVNLIGIEVGSTMLSINPQVFALKPDGLGGCIIDPATPFTTLPRVVYNQLEHELAEQYERMNWPFVQKIDASSITRFTFCYAIHDTRYIPKTPSILFRFLNGASIVVAEPMRRYQYGTHLVYCLQILPGDIDVTIIGAWQQVNNYLTFDISNSQLHMYSHYNCN